MYTPISFVNHSWKKSKQKDCTVCTVCAVWTIWMVCSLHFIMTDATTVECSSLTWSTGMQIWKDKRNCLHNKSVQIPHDLLGFQLGDRPHVSKYDKLWTKIYLVDIYGRRERSTSKSNFRYLNVNRFLWYLAFAITKFKISWGHHVSVRIK